MKCSTPEAPNAILFREFFDVVRFGDRPSYASEFRRWLFEKYRDQPVNVLVATQQLTLDLLAPDDENPWRGVPLVYGTFGYPAVDLGATYPTASGIEAEHPFPQSLGLNHIGSPRDEADSRRWWCVTCRTDAQRALRERCAPCRARFPGSR